MRVRGGFALSVFLSLSLVDARVVVSSNARGDARGMRDVDVEASLYERAMGRRVRESFEKMRANARRSRFRRARRRFVESSAVYGKIFAADAARTARRARETCDAIERDVRAFAREEAVRDDEDEDDEARDGDYGRDFGVGAEEEKEDARTRMATYDVERLRRCFQERANDSETRVAVAAAAIDEDLRAQRSNVEDKFFDELDARFRPMLAAVERRRRRSSVTSARDDVAGDRTDGRAPRDAYPHTTRALHRAFHAKSAAFERRAWMTLSHSVSRARRESFVEFLAHVSGKTPEPLFSSSLRDNDGSLTLDPDADAFVRVVRDAGARWSSTGAVAGETNGRATLDDEDAFARLIDRACEETREAFRIARDYVVDVVTRARERCEDVRRSREDEGPIERFGGVATRADAFARDAIPTGIVRPLDGCVAIDVTNVARELRAAAMSAMEAAAATAVEWASQETQRVARALTRLKLEERDAVDKAARAREIRDETRSLAEAYATLKASRAAKIPDLHVAAFDALEREIDAYARDVAADEDAGAEDTHDVRAT